jgi:DNA polymerase-3 subunit gamma/tau
VTSAPEATATPTPDGRASDTLDVRPDPAVAPAPRTDGPPAAVELGPVVALWPAVLEALKSSSRVAHTLTEGAVPVSRSETTLVLAHPDKVRMAILRGNKGHLELLRLAVLDVVHLDVEVDLVLDPDKAGPSEPAGVEPSRAPVAADPAPAAPGPSARERAAAVVAEEVAPAQDVASNDDDDVEDSGLSGLALVQRELGGTVMTAYDNG